MKKNKHKIIDFKMFVYDFVKFTGAIPVIIALRLKKYYINGKKQKHLYRGSYLIMSNHITYIDPVIISNCFWMRRLSFIATKELFDTKLKDWFFKRVNCIKVDRENVSMKTFKDVKKRTEEGRPVIIFPEGGLERNVGLNSFKSGVVLMALMNHVPIVPVYIIKNDKWYKRQRVVIGEKINLRDYITSAIPSMEDIQNASVLLQEKEKELEALALKIKR